MARKSVRGYRRKDGTRVRSHKKNVKSKKAVRRVIKTAALKRYRLHLDGFKRDSLHQGMCQNWRFSK